MENTRTKSNGECGVDYVSNSSLSTFRGCSHRFDLHYHRNIRPIKTNISLYFGSMLHEAMHTRHSSKLNDEQTKTFFESAFRGGLKATPVMWAGDGKPKMLKNGTYSKARNDFGDAESAIAYGLKCLDAYFQSELEDGVEVWASEVKFEFPLDIDGQAITVIGYIDKIVRINGKVYVLDYKTAAQKEDEEYLQVENQVSTYYLGAKALGFTIDGALFDYIYKTKDPEVVRYYVTRTPEQIEDWKTQAVNTVRAMRTGVTYKNISKMGCKNCDLRKFCWNDEDMSDLYFVKEDDKIETVEDTVE